MGCPVRWLAPPANFRSPSGRGKAATACARLNFHDSYEFSGRTAGSALGCQGGGAPSPRVRAARGEGAPPPCVPCATITKSHWRNRVNFRATTFARLNQRCGGSPAAHPLRVQPAARPPMRPRSGYALEPSRARGWGGASTTGKTSGSAGAGASSRTCSRSASAETWLRAPSASSETVCSAATTW